LKEETGYVITPDNVVLLDVISSPSSNDLLVFCRSRITPAMMPKEDFVPNSEVSEIKRITEPEPLCFKTHGMMMKEFFRR
jgi:hypothetical protein